jgi:hypothetical protein
MDNFKLELMYKGWNPENDRKRVMERALDFRFDYLTNHPELLENHTLRKTFLKRELRGTANFPEGFNNFKNKKDLDKVYSLLQNSERGTFWHTLYNLHGYPRQTTLLSYEPDEKLEARRVEAQQWTNNNLTQEEEQELLTISINQALIPPVKPFAPGHTQGHSILFEQLVKRESPYSSIVSEDFRARLVNGTFWEEVSNMKQSRNQGISYWRIDDILVDYFSDLNSDSAAWGFPIYQRNSNTEFNTHGLSAEALDNYIDFIQRVDEAGHENISQKDLNPFVKAYLSTSLSKSDRDSFHMRFPLKKKRSFRTRMKHPVVQKYIYESEEVLQSFAGFLAGVAVDIDSYYMGDEITEMIRNTPDPTKTMQEMVRRMSPDDRAKIPEFFGDSLKPYTSDYTQGMLDSDQLLGECSQSLQ